VRLAVPLSPIEKTSWAQVAPAASAFTPLAAREPTSATPLVNENVELARDPSPAPGLSVPHDDDHDAALAADAHVHMLEPMAVARELSHWESELLQASNRERLMELAFSIAGCFATRVALFTVHEGLVQGLRTVVGGEARPVDGVILPLDSACMLTEVATRGEPSRVDPRMRALDLRVRDILGDTETTGVAIFPVTIKQRVVNVLYASNGREPLGTVAFGALQLLAQDMGLAYGRLIMLRKANIAGR
jgi:hypothetical protein